MPLKLLILSPYDAASHGYWRRRLVAGLGGWRDIEFTEVTLPARYFSWRFRGNSLTLAHDAQLDADFDVVIATSMTDLATLKGLKPALANTPVILYFHENQFAYPEQFPERQVERQLTSIYSAIAAQQLVFNSEFNRRTFLHGAEALLKKMPDGVPDGIVATLAAKAEVLPVPIQVAPVEGVKSQALNVVWNHRWEHDKGLDQLEQIVDRWVATDADFTFHLIGQAFRQVPAEIQRITERLGSRLGHLGYIEERQKYLELLAASEVVLSTARHEFQGLAVQEAMLSGCQPVVPDDLAYQDYVPAQYRYQSVDQAVAMLTAPHKHYEVDETLRLQLSDAEISSRWQQLIDDVLCRRS